MHHVQGEAAVVAAPGPGARTDLRLTAVALGSNLGRRCAHLSFAVSALGALLADMRVSPFLETDPVGVRPQPRFLNGAAVGLCGQAPVRLLAALLRIEGQRGRERPHPGAARTLDLDLVLMGDLVVRQPHLHLPHPRFRERRFVLEPLAAIAPELIDPLTGRTVRDLLADLESSSPAAQPLPRRASTLQAPGPAAARYRNRKQ